MKIAIVGHGFVGKAVEYGFATPDVETFLVDPRHGTFLPDLKTFDPHLVFLCLPTPMGEDGHVDAALIHDALEYLDAFFSITDRLAMVVIKSTITPDLAEEFCRKNHRVVYNPEFLLEQSAKSDFVNPPFHVFGGDYVACELLEKWYTKYSNCNMDTVIKVTAAEASFIKYSINTFLCLKVTFFNQLYDAIGEKGNFNIISRVLGAEPRIGDSHTKVPGFDMKRGFGGACFPKDISAFVNFSDKLSLLERVIEINNEYRQEYELGQREKDQNVYFTL